MANETLRHILLSLEEYPIPSHYFKGSSVRAFVLGTDPSNFSNGGNTIKLNTVFGLDTGSDKYFKGPIEGLKAIGLSLNDVYVQNLVKNYCSVETGKNKYWHQIADYWIRDLKQEFNDLDPDGKIPVFITAEILYKYLMNKGEVRHTAKQFYTCAVKIPIESSQNKLERPLIPLYRYNRGKTNYWLNNPLWSGYVDSIKQFIDK
jgi:hypothetical protein